jgi:putative transposase
MTANQAQHAISLMAEVLGVSVSGFYAFQNRPPSDRQQRDEELAEQIEEVHAQSRGTYGAPRIYEELKEQGIAIGKKRVARLMKRRGLKGVHRRKWPVTTKRAKRQRPAPDLVERNFTATAPNELWVADITYVPTTAGFLYLAVVLDVFSRRVVGWSMANHLRTELVLDALDMAVQQRRPVDVIHHSDQGCQYTSLAFGNRCHSAGIRPSMGSVGDCYDNALCESFFATLECELILRSHFSSLQQARLAVFDFIEGFYNPRRRHSAIGYLSPINFERQHTSINTVRKRLLLH